VVCYRMSPTTLLYNQCPHPTSQVVPVKQLPQFHRRSGKFSVTSRDIGLQLAASTHSSSPFRLPGCPPHPERSSVSPAAKHHSIEMLFLAFPTKRTAEGCRCPSCGGAAFLLPWWSVEAGGESHPSIRQYLLRRMHDLKRRHHMSYSTLTCYIRLLQDESAFRCCGI
jgi:hypothetical protein